MCSKQGRRKPQKKEKEKRENAFSSFLARNLSLMVVVEREDEAWKAWREEEGGEGHEIFSLANYPSPQGRLEAEGETFQEKVS